MTKTRTAYHLRHIGENEFVEPMERSPYYRADGKYTYSDLLEYKNARERELGGKFYEIVKVVTITEVVG